MEPRISTVTLGVSDLKASYRFYHEGLGFPTTHNPDQGIIFLQTSGVCLALFRMSAIADDVAFGFPRQRHSFPGITLAHNTRTKEEVDEILQLAKSAGGTIVKEAEVAFWGGYSGYFADPDGYLWEVAWAKDWEFQDGHDQVITKFHTPDRTLKNPHTDTTSTRMRHFMSLDLAR